MSRDFELKFDEFKANSRDAEGNNSEDDKYLAHGNARHIAFLWPEKKMQAFNYSYLVTFSYDAGEDKITLEFTSHHITIKGIRLDGLFFEIMAQIPKYIRVMEERYNATQENDEPIINEVVLTEK